MSLVVEKARCPFCKEPIAKGAALCKHCQSLLPPPKTKNKFTKQINTFRTGFLAGILFSIIIFYLAYQHFAQ